ncbi:uncharacterized protein LOC141921931 [Strix aluco]|uniref:uncharacterized protein LOC141921931 n=2 Tax=Strix aluco TaxID=111821 RepID=UPI003DA26C9B
MACGNGPTSAEMLLLVMLILLFLLAGAMLAAYWLWRKRQETKRWMPVEAELENLRSERPWHQADWKWHGMAPCGTAWPNCTAHGTAWDGIMVQHSMVWHGVGQHHGATLHGTAKHDRIVWQSMTCHRMSWEATTQHGMEWHGTVWEPMAWHDTAEHGAAGHGTGYPCRQLVFSTWPQAPCKPHGRPELALLASSEASLPKHRGRKEPAPSLETCDSAKAPSMERLCPLPRISSLSSLSTSSSSSVDTLCSFPEPCPGAMAELAAQKRSGPAQSPEEDEGLVESLGAALGQDPPLEQSAGTRQEQVPGHEGDKAQTPRDVEPAPGSPHARLRTLVIEIWLRSNGAELPVPHMDTDRAEDGDKETRIPNVESLEMDRSSPVKSGSSSPVSLGSTIAAAPGRSSPAEPSPQQRVPAGRTRGRAWEGCAQLCRGTKAWWQRRCQSCRRRFRKPPRQHQC